jgi:hypothetical protein
LHAVGCSKRCKTRPWSVLRDMNVTEQAVPNMRYTGMIRSLWKPRNKLLLRADRHSCVCGTLLAPTCSSATLQKPATRGMVFCCSDHANSVVVSTEATPSRKSAASTYQNRSDPADAVVPGNFLPIFTFTIASGAANVVCGLYVQVMTIKRYHRIAACRGLT